MLLTRENLPQTISDIATLDELLCRPSQALIDDLQKVDGDIMILGVAGKMGPTLAGLGYGGEGYTSFTIAGVSSDDCTWIMR